jgi:hypothetical protein
MKNEPSPIAHPATDENARLWGFDISPSPPKSIY